LGSDYRGATLGRQKHAKLTKEERVILDAVEKLKRDATDPDRQVR